jgi:hypothetical protein
MNTVFVASTDVVVGFGLICAGVGYLIITLVCLVVDDHRTSVYADQLDAEHPRPSGSLVEPLVMVVDGDDVMDQVFLEALTGPRRLVPGQRLSNGEDLLDGWGGDPQ